MIKSANSDYGYNNSDELADTLSSVVIIASSIGEILGPLYAGFASEQWGIEECTTILGIASFIFAVVYFIGTNCANELFNHKFIRKIEESTELQKALID